MIDFIKARIVNVDYQKLLNNPKLDFSQKVKLQTGEVNFPISCEIGNMKLEIKSETFIELKGSLHKFFKGGNNFDDFYFSELVSCVNQLCAKIEIQPKDIVLRNIEIGVNVHLDFDPMDFCKRLISYKYRPFSQMVSMGRESLGVKCAGMQQYEVKIYSKKNKCLENILRIEKKVVKMNHLKEFNLLTFQDLLNQEKLGKTSIVLKAMLKEILIVDYSLDETKLKPKERLKLSKFNNPYFWHELKQKYSLRNKHKKNFSKILSLHGKENYLPMVNNLVESKFELLLNG